jgi:uncharacterized membrane protein YuzA (DUF378 family)
LRLLPTIYTIRKNDLVETLLLGDRVLRNIWYAMVILSGAIAILSLPKDAIAQSKSLS